MMDCMQSSLTILSSNFTRNRAKWPPGRVRRAITYGATNGGAVNVRGGNLTMIGCSVNRSMAARGGAVSVERSLSMAMHNTSITNCQADIGGGVSVDDVLSITLINQVCIGLPNSLTL